MGTTTATTTAAGPIDPVAVTDGEQRTLSHGPLTRTDFVRYAGAGGDFNPIHHDEGFAQAAGLPSVFGHGPLTAGIVGRLVAEWFGLANVRAYSVRFTSRVWPDDVVTCTGTVTSVREEAGERLASVDLRAERADGEVVVRAAATARVA